MRMELIQRNPVSLVSPPPIARRAVDPPDISAVQETLALARRDDHHLYACIHLVAYTGLRRGEALGLLWDSVDLSLRRIFIEGSLVRSQERGLILEPPKTHSGLRAVDMEPVLSGCLPSIGSARRA